MERLAFLGLPTKQTLSSWEQREDKFIKKSLFLEYIIYYKKWVGGWKKW